MALSYKPTHNIEHRIQSIESMIDEILVDQINTTELLDMMIISALEE